VLLCGDRGYGAARVPGLAHSVHVFRFVPMQFQGIRNKSGRGFRRNLASTPLYELFVNGESEKIPGKIIELSRAGGWANGSTADGTMCKVYTGPTQEAGGSHHLGICSGGRRGNSLRELHMWVDALGVMNQAGNRFCVVFIVLGRGSATGQGVWGAVVCVSKALDWKDCIAVVHQFWMFVT
jgi:hypothetical protein